MGKFMESRTAKNLLTAFSLETQARTRYNFFAERAEKERYIQIARIFNDTAAQEYEHALRFFKFFNGGELEIKWTFPAGVVQDTNANLVSAADLELAVHSTMYPGFAKIALEEGFQRAADTLNAIKKDCSLRYIISRGSVLRSKVFMQTPASEVENCR